MAGKDIFENNEKIQKILNGILSKDYGYVDGIPNLDQSLMAGMVRINNQGDVEKEKERLEKFQNDFFKAIKNAKEAEYQKTISKKSKKKGRKKKSKRNKTKKKKSKRKN